MTDKLHLVSSGRGDAARSLGRETVGVAHIPAPPFTLVLHCGRLRVYVADTLALLNCYPRWWGEGDAKIYVDGETFPSHFGTGSEDYYGYTYCRTDLFSCPFYAQPRAAANWQGHTTNTLPTRHHTTP